MGAQAMARKEKLRLFLPLFLLIHSSVIGALALLLTIALYPKTYDLYLYAFDAVLGFQASFWMGRMFVEYPLLAAAGKAVYTCVPLAITLLYAFQVTSPHRSPVDILYVFFGAGFTGLFLYHFFPATGPVYIFGSSFPWSPPPLESLRLIPVPAQVPRNAMPSVHTAWALLIWWNSRERPAWVRTLAGLFLALTLASTLGMGEHYLTDLIVAVPFTVAIQAAFTRTIPLNRPERSQALMAGAGLTVIWLIALRTSMAVFERLPALAWAAVLITVAIPVLFERRLAAVNQDRQANRYPDVVAVQ
jgi:hypothetical protein